MADNTSHWMAFSTTSSLRLQTSGRVRRDNPKGSGNKCIGYDNPGILLHLDQAVLKDYTLSHSLFFVFAILSSVINKPADKIPLNLQ